MKKIVLNLIVVISIFMFIPLVSAKEKVQVYMFSREECAACETAQKYFDKLLEKDSDMFELIEIEAFDDSGRVLDKKAFELMKEILKRFSQDTEKMYTPTIIIGDNIWIGTENINEIENIIKKYKEQGNKSDKVKEIAKEMSIDINDIRTNKPVSGKYDILILAGIFVIVIGGFAGLVFLGKK